MTLWRVELLLTFQTLEERPIAFKSLSSQSGFLEGVEPSKSISLLRLENQVASLNLHFVIIGRSIF